MFTPTCLATRSESTKQKYIIVIRHLERFLGRPPLVSDLQDDVVLACLTAMQERGLSPFSINGYRDKYIRLADHAFRKSMIRETLDIPKFSEPPRTTNTLSEGQVDCLMAAASATRGKIGELPASLWWPALILTIYDTAARVGSLLTVEWRDVDLEAGTICLRAVPGRLYHDSIKSLHSSTIRLLRSLRDARADDDDTAKVFPWPLNRDYLWESFRKISLRAGLPTGRQWKFHAIRRTTLTHTINTLGLSATTDLADYTSDLVTRKTYVDQRPCDALPRPDAGPPPLPRHRAGKGVTA